MNYYGATTPEMSEREIRNAFLARRRELCSVANPR